jgi:riboflavin biosynthesis pyrimidine reductase
MRRLTPDPGPVDLHTAIPELRLAERAPRDRPYVIANFVESVDGRATVKGGSTGLGSAGDKAIFRTLRGCADAVLAGVGTISAEHYGRMVREPEVAALRARLGLPAQPPLVTITRSGSLPDGIPLLDDPDSELIVYAGTELTVPDAAARVVVARRQPGQLTMAAVLADLRARGIGLLLCEGGPTLFSQLVTEGVCDELFVTLAAALAGGDGGAITHGLQLDDPAVVSLLWALEQDSALFLRYGISEIARLTDR